MSWVSHDHRQHLTMQAGTMQHCLAIAAQGRVLVMNVNVCRMDIKLRTRPPHGISLSYLLPACLGSPRFFASCSLQHSDWRLILQSSFLRSPVASESSSMVSSPLAWMVRWPYHCHLQFPSWRKLEWIDHRHVGMRDILMIELMGAVQLR